MDHGNVLTFLTKHVKNFKVNRRSHVVIFTCPACNTPETAQFVPGTSKVNCHKCKYVGDIVDISLMLGVSTTTDTAKIKDQLCVEFGLENSRIKQEVLDFYKASGFDLTPLQKHSKIPFELDWLNNPHKEVFEWDKWLALGMNIGVKTGTRSNITIIDVDQADIPADIDLLKGNALIQKTGRGWHLIYKYTSELPTSKIHEYKIDILNDGKQAVLFPSVVLDKDTNKETKREYITPLVLSEIPADLLKLLKSKLDDKTIVTVEPASLHVDPNFKVNLDELSLKNNNLEGCRHDTLVKLGGLLINQLSLNDTSYVLRVLNKNLLSNEGNHAEMTNIINSVKKFEKSDSKKMTEAIFKYLNVVEFANSKEIKDALGFPKEDIDKCLAQLAKELRLIKRGRNFSVVKRADWKTSLNMTANLIDFEMPYFHQYAGLCYGDNVLLASQTKNGKCIADGYILTRNGYIDIAEYGKSMPEGITDLSSEHLYYGRQNRYVKASYFYKEKVNKTIRIKTYQGFELEGTEEHPILIHVNGKPEWKKLKDIDIADEVVLTKTDILGEDNNYLFNSFTVKNNIHASNCTNVLLPSHMEPELARLIGYYIADGVLGKNTVRICSSKDYIKTDVKKICQKYRITWHELPGAIDLQSRVYCDLLRFFFKTDKHLIAKYKYIPDCIMTSSEQNIRECLTAYLDCDSGGNNEGLELVTASEKLCKQVHLLLLSLGIMSRRTIKHNKQYNRDYYRISINVEDGNKYYSMMRSLKYANLTPYVQQKRSYYVKKLDSRSFSDKVVKIEVNNEEKYVYDFHVPNQHAFWSNGFVSHNTTIAMNIIKRIRDQLNATGSTRKIYYMGSEAGSRFMQTAMTVGLKEGDFEWDFVCDPTKINLENDSITILDWLMVENKAESDLVMKYFSEQLHKSNGFLITFMQLKEGSNPDWFAPNLIKQFPALAARYLYTDEGKGEKGNWVLDAIREPKGRFKTGLIPCTYDYTTKLLKED